jgi:hypothetical protein
MEIKTYRLAVLMATLGVTLLVQGAVADEAITFDLVRSAAAENAGCLPDVTRHVKIVSLGPVEKMRIDVSGLPADTEFDVFVIQVPNALLA